MSCDACGLPDDRRWTCPCQHPPHCERCGRRMGFSWPDIPLSRFASGACAECVPESEGDE